jgi:prevent-host-death family protein
VYDFSMTDVPLAVAEERLRSLVRRTALTRERVIITDQGRPVAALISPDELADLAEAQAVLQCLARDPSGQREAPHREAMARLAANAANRHGYSELSTATGGN